MDVVYPQQYLHRGRGPLLVIDVPIYNLRYKHIFRLALFVTDGLSVNKLAAITMSKERLFPTWLTAISHG